jgi:hypothetical protein
MRVHGSILIGKGGVVQLSIKETKIRELEAKQNEENLLYTSEAD